MMKLQSGGCEIYASGSIIPAGNNPVEMIFDEEMPPQKYTFSFDNDANGAVEKTTLKRSGMNTIEITFCNFNQGVDNATPAPLKLGTLNGKELLFSYRIDALNDSSVKIFNYAWYLKEPENEN